MELKIETYLNNQKKEVSDDFYTNNKSKLAVNIDYHHVEYDYSFLEKIEGTIPYIDKIIRNPKRFIAQEEEILPVEKSKHITLESIKHLATHTNLIQEFDREAKTITPSRVLNINKEESFDIYENRFIYTLLNNTLAFLFREKKQLDSLTPSKNDRQYNYNSKTRVGKEIVDTTISMRTYKVSSKTDDMTTVKLRIDKLIMIISDFLKSSFIKDLISSQVLPVKSPIRKTNTILKNPNFQQALLLWEYIERHDKVCVVDEKKLEEYEDDGLKKDMLDSINYLQYLVLIDETDTKKGRVNKFYIKQLIKDFVENNELISKKDFRKIVNQEFDNYYNKKSRLNSKITNIFNKEIKRFNDNIKESLGLLR